jgi:predicted nucleic acid-binding protein
MALLIDTSVLIELERRNLPLEALAVIAPDERIALAAVSVAELRVGALRANTAARRLRRETLIEAILNVVPVLAFDLAVAQTHVRIWAELLATGRMIGAHDLQIAATALTYDYDVLTHNARDFSRVSDLSLRAPVW